MDTRTPASTAPPQISVCVITYNHAKYILECLEGIRRQVDAPTFEVIVRDDASTDETGNIVRSYIEKNRLSNFFYHGAGENGGMMKNLTTALRLCRGQFVALCEGDDYWTDPSKLRKQHALMASQPGCTIVAHAAFIDAGNGRPARRTFHRAPEVTRFELRDILSASSTQFAPTASYMIRRDIVDQLPDWFEGAPIGDFFLELLSLKKGYGLYMPDTMSAYRVFSTGSWSSGMRNDRRRSIEYAQRMLKLIAKLESDEQLKANGLHILKANVTALLAMDYLLCGEFEQFRDRIEESFSLDMRWQSRTATYLYRLRHFPSMASFLYRAKRAYLE